VSGYRDAGRDESCLRSRYDWHVIVIRARGLSWKIRLNRTTRWIGGIIRERTTMSSVRRRFSPAEIKGKANLDKKPLANSKRVETTRGMKKSNGSSSNGGSDGGGRGMTILRPLCRLRNHAKVYRRSLGRSSQGLPPREDKKGWSFVCRDS